MLFKAEKPEFKTLHENFDPLEKFKEVIDDFGDWVDKKLKGYSTGEVDKFIKAAETLHDESGKRSLMQRIKTSIKEIEIKLAKEDSSSKKEELRLQKQVLTKLLSKVEEFDSTAHIDHKNTGNSGKKVIDLDEA